MIIMGQTEDFFASNISIDKFFTERQTSKIKKLDR